MLMGLMPIFQVLLSPDFGASYGSTEYERELVGKKMTSVFVKKKKNRNFINYQQINRKGKNTFRNIRGHIIKNIIIYIVGLPI